MAETVNIQRWAVIIGIDHYSKDVPEANLHGCANDAFAVYDFFTQSMNFPVPNIKLLVEPSPVLKDSSKKYAYSSPTKNNILLAIEGVKHKCAAGDTVLIHFSGHGDRHTTQYPGLKPSEAQDEVLCLLNDHELSDVDFGSTLDELSAQGCVVCVLLDCCFSGGSTRKRSDCRVRSRSVLHSKFSAENDTRNAHQTSRSEEVTPALRGSRNAAHGSNWLHRKRGYNVFAACLPHEESLEGPDDQGQYHGALTLAFLQTMQSILYSWHLMTYAQFQCLLEARVKTLWAGKQKPMLVGEAQRLLFQAPILKQTDRLIAFVTEAKDDILIIDRGSVAGSKVGDRYFLEVSKDSASGPIMPSYDLIECEAIEVHDFTSRLQYCDIQTELLEVRPGMIARLTQRNDKIVAKLYCASGDGSAMRCIQEQWTSFVDPLIPIHLIFSHDSTAHGDTEAAKFYVDLHGEELTVRNPQLAPYPNLPTVPANTPDTPKRLMSLLQRLQNFKSVQTLQGPSTLNPLPCGHSIHQLPRDGLDADAVSSWAITLRNQSQRMIFATILNLTPLYGVYQCHPWQEGNSAAIEPSTEITFEFNIEASSQLRAHSKMPGWKMRDVMKTFVATEPVPLGLYLQEDIVDSKVYRHARPRGKRAVAHWRVFDVVIETVLDCASGKLISRQICGDSSL